MIRVVDVETTGRPEDEVHAICEMGWIDVHLTEGFPIRGARTFFVLPGHPIPPATRAVHHISDHDVAGAMPPSKAVAELLGGLGPDDVLCAHKAEFERAFIDAGDRPWICTWKCALRAWPDFASHSNQSIRYELGIDDEPGFDPLQAMPPHRSLPDVYVTAHIVRRLLRMRPVERLVEVSQQPAFLSNVNFGKHRGKTFKQVAAQDPDYLRWVFEQSEQDANVKFTARWHFEHRQVSA